jgi:hypothetical protein
MKLEFPRKTSEKFSNIKFHENRSSQGGIVPCVRMNGETDIRKVIAAFQNFAKAPKNQSVNAV